jgi:molybdopterin synthase sulfur carrier subunit
MAIQVQIPSQLRPLAGGAAQLALEADSVASLIDALGAKHAGLRERLLEPSGELRRFVRVFVNEEDIRFLDEQQTKLKDGDTVAIVPAIAGG